MTLSILIDVVVVVWVLYRQVQVRRVRARVNLRMSAILAVVGLIELIAYAGNHHLSGRVVGVLVLSLIVGAGVLGALRAATVHLWRNENGVFRQGTWLTMALWIISLGLHFGSEWWIDKWKGPSGLASVSLLLYIGITYGVQNAVVQWRAKKLLAAGGPMGGRAAPFAGHWWAGTWTPPSSRSGPGGRRDPLTLPPSPSRRRAKGGHRQPTAEDSKRRGRWPTGWTSDGSDHRGEPSGALELLEGRRPWYARPGGVTYNHDLTHRVYAR